MEQPTARPALTTASPRTKHVRTYAICFLAGLLIGLVPTGIRVVQAQRERDALERQLRVAGLEMDLSSAAVLARHGDYAAAREAASRFFSGARQAIDNAGDGTLTPAQLSSLQSTLADRDALITLLARGDPAGAERLTTLYVAHRASFPR